MKSPSLQCRLLSFLLPAVVGLSLVLSAQAAQFSIATNSSVGLGGSAAFDGTNYLIGVLSSTNITAQIISSSGTLIGPPITGIGTSQGFPRVAFGSTNYLMVWRDDFVAAGVSAFGQLISRSGVKVGSAFPLALTSGGSLRSIASDGTNFLVLLDSGTGQSHYGQVVSQAGILQGPPTLINTSPYGGNDAALAFDGTNYLAVWNRQGSPSSDIYGQFISRNGGLVGANFAIDADTLPSDNPIAVVFDGTKYFVVFSDEVGGQGTGTWDTFGRFVTPAGSVLTNRVAIATATGAQRFPSVAFDGANYLVLWNDRLGMTNSDIKFKFFDANGQPMSSEFSAFTSQQGTNLPVFGSVLFDGRRYAAVAWLGSINTSFQTFSADVYGSFISPLPRGAFPIAITSSNDFGFSAAFDGTNYLVGIQGGPAAHDEITAQLFSPTGALIGPRISTGRFGGIPRVVFDSINYLMVWEDVHNVPLVELPVRDLYGQFISPSGTLVRPPIAISTAPGNQLLDSINHVAFDGSNFLVVWRDERNGSGNRDIYGQLVTPAGTLFGAEIPIATQAESEQEASAAFDGTNFLVVWQSKRAAPPELYDTYGKLISKTGVPGSAFLISQNPSARHNPTSVAFDGTNYLVVWNRDIGPGFPSPDDWDIYARLVTRAGAFVGNEFPITTAPGSQPFFGGAIYDGANYLVSWVDEASSSAKNRFFTRSGAPLTAEFSLFGAQGNRFPFGGFFFDGSRLFAGASYVDANFSNGDVYGLILPKTRLDFAAPVANGQVPLRFTGMPGVTYEIYATTNLLPTNTVWTLLTSSDTLNGTFNFTDTNAASVSRRFYRAVQQ